MFYVYAYIRSTNSVTACAGTPYYIGKGKDYRAWDSKHLVPLPKNKEYLVILEANLTEIGSLALERRYIRWWGRKDIGTGILMNRTDGGEGSTGFRHSAETKHKLSEIFLNHRVTKETKEKMSQRAFGRKASTETKEKLSKASKGRTSALKGKKITESTKEKISKSMTGIKRTHETRKKMSKPKMSVMCPHCGTTGGNPAMIRWHFDKCKDKK